MDSHSQATHREDDDDEEAEKALDPPPATVTGTTTTISTTTTTTTTTIEYQNGVESEQVREDTETSQNGDSMKQEPIVSESEPTTSKTTPPEDNNNNNNNNEQEIEEEEENEDDEDDEEEDEPPPKKQKQLSSITEQQEPVTTDNNHVNKVIKTPALAATTAKKKSKKKNNNNVWVTRSTRKGKKKTKPNPQNTPAQDTVLITPVPRFHDKTDDTPDMSICLSKVYKAEKVELSEDRLSAASAKGYRMVRATRGVCEGAWYFEIKVVNLGESGHTRLGWSMEKGDLQAPVGYDANSFGYRDIDGSKVHKALREKYGDEGYKESDVIGFYINLPDGSLYAPKPPHLVWYKGQRYVCAPDSKEDPPKIIPESEISFFKNGICQGVAFKDLFGGRYYPAASMYTLPNQPNCVVKFNFGPDFEFFPEDFGGRPTPRPMSEVPYHGFDSRVENDTSNEVKN